MSRPLFPVYFRASRHTHYCPECDSDVPCGWGCHILNEDEVEAGRESPKAHPGVCERCLYPVEICPSCFGDVALTLDADDLARLVYCIDGGHWQRCELCDGWGVITVPPRPSVDPDAYDAFTEALHPPRRFNQRTTS